MPRKNVQIMLPNFNICDFLDNLCYSVGKTEIVNSIDKFQFFFICGYDNSRIDGLNKLVLALKC